MTTEIDKLIAENETQRYEIDALEEKVRELRARVAELAAQHLKDFQRYVELGLSLESLNKLLEQALVALKSTGIMWPIVAAAIQAIEGRAK